MRLFRPPRWITWLYRSCTWRFVVSEPVVFLTFDDGPHPAITPFVLDELARCKMTATFFCVGENLLRYPEIAQRILNEGHTIGNHTQTHTKGISVSNETYYRSVESFPSDFPTVLFRPPYGKMKMSQRRKLRKTYRIILWSWLSYDYDQQVPLTRILESGKKLKAGDIIVLHDNPKIADRQRELLPQFLQLLKEKGLTSKAIPSH